MNIEILKIYTFIDGINDKPFPNADNQIEIPYKNYSAKRMGSINLSATVKYKDCLDDLWTRNEYVKFRGEKYWIRKIPSSSKSNDDIRYSHDIEFEPDRNMLNTVYFYDVVTDNVVTDKYVSNSSKVVFFGDIHEFAGRMNYSLKYSNVPYRVVIDDGISSEAKLMSFEDQFFSNVLQEIYNVFELPYYFDGYIIHIGFTNNAITHTFKYGFENELISISKTNANYKIINRCTGIGSATNIPLFYPNPHGDREVIEAEGGKWITPTQNLMPPIYRESLGAERFYNAKNNTYKSPETGEYYIFENEYVDGNPKEHKISFDEIKPTIKEIVNAQGYRIDMFSEFAFDDNDNDDFDEETGEYLHPYFYGKLRKFNGDWGFNLFEHAISGEDMRIAMTDGSCGACEFVIGVIETEANVFKNPVQVDEIGRIAAGDYEDKVNENNFQDQQQNTITNNVWVALRKDISTFGVIMPNAENNYRPSTNDTFVILGIDLPQAYIAKAENDLFEAIIKHMATNNSDKFNYSNAFSRIALAENPDILAQLNENARLQLEYNGKYHELYVSSYSYSVREGDILPDIQVELSDTLTISKNTLETSIDAVKEDIMSSIGSVDFYKQGLRYFLRKDTKDIAREFITFIKGLDVGTFSSLVSGGTFRMDRDGKSYLEVDKMLVRMKATFNNLEIKNTTSIGGEFIISPASIKCIKVEDVGVAYRCYFMQEQDGIEIQNEFAVNDQAICKETNMNVDSGFSNRYYWRLVVGVGKDYIDLSKTDADSSSDTPQDGDDIVQLGNRNNRERQNAIIQSSVSVDAPTIKFLQGINSYTLDGKDLISMGFDTDTNRAYFNVYGDAYIGNVDKSSYMQYTQEKGLEIKGTLTTKGGVNVENEFNAIGDSITNISNITNENSQFINVIGKDLEEIHNQLDGAIESWFADPDPTLTNYPASNWITNEDKNIHLGDLYYSNKGKAYRFQYNDSTKTYYWNPITDTDILLALEAAKNAQDTADGKRKVFVRQPVNTDDYDIGDLWVNATYGTTYNNDLLRCKIAKKSGVTFNISHWELASKYTDDTTAIAAQNAADVANNAANAAATAVTNLNTYVDGAFKDGVINEAEAIAIEKYINTVNNAKAEINSTYTILYANTYLDGIEKTNLATAKSGVDGAINNLINSINTAIADGKTTATEKADVDRKYEAFITSYTTFNTRVEQANKKIQDNLKKYSDTAQAAADKALGKFADYDYLKEALENDTKISGGLIVSSILSTGYSKDGVFTIMSGINGIYNESKAGGGISYWSGGSMVDKENLLIGESNSYAATALIRMDGTGYVANGALSWDNTGKVTGDPNSFFLGEEKVADILKMFSPYYEGNLVTAITPNHPFRHLTINNNLILNNVDGRYIQIGGIRLVYDAINNAIKVVKNDGSPANFYATGGLSALGIGSISGGGGGFDYLWELRDVNADVYSAPDGSLLYKKDGLWDYKNESEISYNLPVASSTVLGGVKVGQGLAIDSNGILSSTYSYTLPTASATILGGVKVGNTLEIASGVLNQKSGIVTTGTFTKVTTDTYGRVISGTVLSSSDIPSIDASKITSGILPVLRGGTGKSGIASGSMYYASSANVLSEVVTTAFGRGLLNASNGVLVGGLNADTVDGYHYNDIINSSDSRYVKKTGDTITGMLTVNSAITSNNAIQGTRLISTIATGTAPLTVSSTTTVMNLNADLLDGYHYGSFLFRQRMQNNTINSALNVGAIPFNVLACKGAGQALGMDPEFSSGNGIVGLYNNANNGATVITRVADSSSANSSGYILQFTNIAAGSPELGGFHNAGVVISRSNAIFVQIFRAKLPVGYSFNAASNSMGTSYTDNWITDTEGTGKWEWYGRVIYCGYTGTFSSGSHVYVSGEVGVTWYMSHCNVYDLTKGGYDGLLSQYTTRLQTARTLWGQTFDGGQNISGNMSGVGSILMSGGLSGVTNGIFSSYVNIGGNLTVSGDYIQIGSGRIRWDAVNNAIYVEKSDGTGAHFYSKGGITALGEGSESSTGGLITKVYAYGDLGTTIPVNLSSTFNADTTNKLYGRVVNIENNVPLSFVASGSGNVVTAISKSGNVVTYTKGINALTAITKPMVEAVLTGKITSHYHTYVVGNDTRGTASTPSDYNMGFGYDFKSNTVAGLNDGGVYTGLFTIRKYGSSGTDFTGGKTFQMAFTDNSNMWIRFGASGGWESYQRVLTSSNYQSIIGGNLSGYVKKSGDTMGGSLTLSSGGYVFLENGWFQNSSVSRGLYNSVGDARWYWNGSSWYADKAITSNSTIQGTRLISTVATGTAPLTVASTTLVPNLNADLLDGYHASNFPLEFRSAYTPTGSAPRWVRIAYFNYNSPTGSWSGEFHITNGYYNNPNYGIYFNVTTSHTNSLSDIQPVITQTGGYGAVFSQIRIVKDVSTTYANFYLEVYYNTTSANNMLFVSYKPADNSRLHWTLYPSYTAGGVGTNELALTTYYTTYGIGTTGYLRIEGTGYFGGQITANGGIIGSLTGNASSATVLQNTRTIWGQSFNGGANVSGNMTGVGSISASGDISGLRLFSNSSGITSSFGAENGSWCHFRTTAPAFYFDKPVGVNGTMYPYSTNTFSCGTSAARWLNVFTTSLDVAGKSTFSDVLTSSGIQMQRKLAAQKGAISWFDSSFNSWQTLMSPVGAGQGIKANITTVSGSLVTGWALRSIIEPNTGYGWTWEGMSSAGTTPSIVAELSSATGDFRTKGSISASRIYTGYDPGIANSISCSGWFRASGASGIFFASYGGGIHMTDSTWVRIYNGKQFYVSSTVDAELSVTPGAISTAGGIKAAKNICSDANIVAAGGITALGTGTSDMRLKCDFKKLNGLTTMKSIGRAFLHHWNETALLLNKHLSNEYYNPSFSAQEVHKHFPVASLTGLYGQDYLGIKREDLIPVMWNAILELERKYIELENKYYQLIN